MKLYDTLDLLLEDKKEGKFYDSSVVTYKRKLEVFIEFLRRRCSANDNNYQDLLRGLSQERIIESIQYYVSEYGINFKVTVDCYFSAIKSFFKFLSDRFNIINQNFDSNQKLDELKSNVIKKEKELKLNTTHQKPPIIRSVYNELNNHCNSIISHFDTFNIQSELADKRELTEYLSAIVVKVVMFTGVKNQVINRIAYEDFNESLNKIRINNLWIHLPDNLSTQLKRYLKIREIIVDNTSPRYPLFINKNGVPFATDYNSMFKIIEQVIGSRKAESIAKYTIMEMIKNGISFSLILEMTSFGIDTCLHCEELINEEKKEDLANRNRLLDSKLRGTDTFDML